MKKLYGVDLSSYQGTPDFKLIKADGNDFVILRLITKDGSVDDSFYYNFEQCKKYGLAVGVYIFSYDLTEKDSRNRSIKGIEALSGEYLELPFFIDLELSTQKYCENMYDIIDGFRCEVEKAGYRFGIYCNQDWYKNVPDIRKFNYPLWIARYGKNDGSLKEKYKPNCGEAIWQYTSNAVVSGISGRCDRNAMYINIIEWEKGKITLPDLTGYVGVSITKALQQKGYDSSFSYRKTLAKELGITNYEGTAEQNLEMIVKLGGCTTSNIPSLKGYKGLSIVAGLKQFGYKSDFEYRKTLWSKIGKTDTYKGTALQNLTLLNYLKNN